MKRALTVLGILFFMAPASGETKTFKVLHVDQLVAWMKSESSPRLFDANVESTRTHVGIIPGATLLPSSNQYDVARELPGDKSAPLVFYCANTQCTASHDAARRALRAGHEDVSVLVDGVYGWRKAGEPLESVAKKPQPVEPKAVAELARLHSALVIDVREEEERHELVPNAQSLPMSRADDAKEWAAFTSKLPRDKVIVFHCAAGVRARRAAEKLASAGFRTAFFKGPDQWRAAGLPLERGPAP